MTDLYKYWQEQYEEQAEKNMQLLEENLKLEKKISRLQCDVWSLERKLEFNKIEKKTDQALAEYERHSQKLIDAYRDGKPLPEFKEIRIDIDRC
tara:strand:+ start:395 stop:676 length:282 start_codon:yes stop_codon:yes gene_type:complete